MYLGDIIFFRLLKLKVDEIILAQDHGYVLWLLNNFICDVKLVTQTKVIIY